MILAQELGVDVLTVIDDNAARKTARYAAPYEGRSNCSGVKSRAFLDWAESGTNILKNML